MLQDFGFSWKRVLGFLTLVLLLSRALPAHCEPIIDRVPENAPFGWDVGAFSSGPYTVTAEEQATWERLYPLVTGLVNDDLIVSLSRYAIAATKNYHFVPAQAGRLEVLGYTPDYVIYEATLANLPAPPAVVRQLKVFILGLNADHQLLANRIALTIRGQRFE